MSRRVPDVVVLGGAGHVGLPLALSLADVGMTVGIYDRDAMALDMIRQGHMPFLEPDTPELLRWAIEQDRLILSAEPYILAAAETVIIVVGTPVEEYSGPTMTAFERLADQIANYLRKDSLIILRSTVYPGTTQAFKEMLQDRGWHGSIAFCPERIAEGHALEELRSLPQIIGADDRHASVRAARLFEQITTGIYTTSAEAELIKLFTNAWRYIKFAVTNQFLMLADEANVDYSAIMRAMKENYPRAADLPGPGFAAGPCLFKDTMQLAAFASTRFPIGQAAMQVNEGLPAWIVTQIERRRPDTVGILGMAFKAESDDIRASLSYKLRNLLEWRGYTVLCSDPYVADGSFLPPASVVDRSDVVVVAVPHREYRALSFAGTDVIDLWDIDGQGIRT